VISLSLKGLHILSLLNGLRKRTNILRLSSLSIHVGAPSPVHSSRHRASLAKPLVAHTTETSPTGHMSAVVGYSQTSNLGLE